LSISRVVLTPTSFSYSGEEMNVVALPYLDASKIKRFKVRRVSKDVYGQDILRKDLIKCWNLNHNGDSLKLPRSWSFVNIPATNNNFSYYIHDQYGNRRGKMRFCRYEDDGILLGSITVFHRFDINKSTSGRAFFYVLDRMRNAPVIDAMRSANETQLRSWLEDNYSDYKDPFSYWEQLGE